MTASLAFSAPQTLLDGISADMGRPAPDVLGEMEQFCALLNKWQRIQNLVSRETLNQFWTRHALDSLQVFDLMQPKERVVLDLGSGGGLPALPLAIASKALDRQFHLVESNGRKVSFLREVIRTLNLQAKVHAQRIESHDSRETGGVDLVTARALASLPQLLAFAHPHIGENGRALFHKGRDYVEEVQQAGAHWHFDVVKIPSETDSAAVILDIRNIRPRVGTSES